MRGGTGISEDLKVVSMYAGDGDHLDMHLPIVGDLLRTAKEVDHSVSMDRVPSDDGFAYVKNWDDRFGDVKKLVKMRIEAKELFDYSYAGLEAEESIKFEDGGTLGGMEPADAARLASIMINDFTFRLRRGSKLRNLLLTTSNGDDQFAVMQTEDYNDVRLSGLKAVDVLSESTSHKINKYVIRDWFCDVDSNLVGGVVDSLGLLHPHDSLTLTSSRNGYVNVKVDETDTIGVE